MSDPIKLKKIDWRFLTGSGSGPGSAVLPGAIIDTDIFPSDSTRLTSPSAFISVSGASGSGSESSSGSNSSSSVSGKETSVGVEVEVEVPHTGEYNFITLVRNELVLSFI